MTKWFHNPVSGQVFDLDVDNADAIRAAIQNGAVEIPDPTFEEGEGDTPEDDNTPPEGGKPSRRKKGTPEDDGGA